MGKVNKKAVGEKLYTKQGAPAKQISATKNLRRSVLATMLWEDTFYENGQAIADNITKYVAEVPGDVVAALAVELRSKGKLRHVPLKVVRDMAKLPTHKEYVAEALANIIQRPDELSEFLAIYWKDGKEPLSAQVKKGLAKAFTKFDEFSLAKYNRDNAIKLRDVLFLCHAKPKNEEQDKLWKRLINDELATPDTWEVKLSATKGEGKKEAWTEMLKPNEEGKIKLGALALLRNLRNFKENGVSDDLVRNALANINVERVLPFRFITAARYAPALEPELEVAMLKCPDSKEKVGGKTRLLIDVSGSMARSISAKSELTRMDAACALAILAREMFSDVEIYTFSREIVQVPTRRGFALRDAIVGSQAHLATYLGKAVNKMNSLGYDRLIVFTDEQSDDVVGDPIAKNSYLINVASEKNGVGYGKWNHIDGFSEAVLDYIVEFEKLEE